MRYKRKRLNLNVKKEFQMWLLVRLLGTVLLSSIIAALILYFYARHEVTSTFFDAHLKIRRVSDLLLPVVLAGSAVSLFGGMFLAIFLPQKIAGPIFRVEQDLLLVQQGDLTTTIRLRQGDVLHELAETFNETSATLRQAVQEIKESCDLLEKSLKEDDRIQISQAMAALQENLRKLNT